MLDTNRAAAAVIKFLRAHGYSPDKVVSVPVCTDIMREWASGTFSDEQTLKALGNIEVLTKKSLKTNSNIGGLDGEEKEGYERPRD
jgi:hypothetical protein